MKRYETYKNSGVEWIGEIPSEWKVVPVKSIFSERGEVTETGKEELLSISEYWGVLPRREVMKEGEFLTRANSLVGYKKCKRGDIVSNIMLAWKGCLGTAPCDGIVSPAYCVYVPSENLNSNFYNYLFRSSQCKLEFRRNSRGLIESRLRLYTPDFFSIRVPLPPLSEQQQISSYLDYKVGQIDSSLAKIVEQIEDLKSYRQSVISEAVTKGLNPNAKMKDSGVEWIGEIPEGWEMKKIKYLKSQAQNAFVDGPFGSNLKSEHFVENGDVYVIESGTITTGKFIYKKFKTITQEHFETIRRSECRANDIIIAKIGANYGMAGELPILDKPSVVSGNSLKITLDNTKMLNSVFIYLLQLIKHRGAYVGIVQETAQPALSLLSLNNMSLPTPPLSEQQQIASYLDSKTSKIDSSIQALELQKSQLEDYKRSLISEAVTGKVDLRGWKQK